MTKVKKKIALLLSTILLITGERTKSVVPVSRRYLERRATVVLFDDFTSGSIDSTKWSKAVTGFGGGVRRHI